eukprot:TRINITY_DN2227_c0_g1_i1.p1 TRINITY_DN2227_c0_g1~~TRINITY_DN2227_c0_g1_i1.p1  ORF type:complete len:277 (-),score=61.16 TRINITY_DN2227_c0_g1_i1:241-1071(-)
MHVIFLLHGLLGSSDDLKQIAAFLEEESEKEFRTYLLKRMENQTLLGIDHCSRVVLLEIFQILSNMSLNVEEMNSTISISFIAHSFGGIILRNILPEFCKFALSYNFNLNSIVFIAVPMITLRNFQINMFTNRLVEMFLKQTGSELLGLDDDQKMNELSSSKEHLGALIKFERRVLIGNVEGDFVVPSQTSLLTQIHILPELRISLQKIDGKVNPETIDEIGFFKLFVNLSPELSFFERPKVHEHIALISKGTDNDYPEFINTFLLEVLEGSLDSL